MLVPEDIAIVLSKSEFDCCRDFQVIKPNKVHMNRNMAVDVMLMKKKA